MSDDHNKNARSKALVPDCDEALSEADDGTLTGDTLMELVTIPFFVGGESFVNDLVDEAARDEKGQAEVDAEGQCSVSEVAIGSEDEPMETDDQDEEGDDDTLTSFSHYDSLFPDEDK